MREQRHAARGHDRPRLRPGHGQHRLGGHRAAGQPPDGSLGHGCIVTSARDDTHVRLRQIHDEARLLIRRFKPDVVVLEELFVNVNVKTALAVGQAKGVLYLAAGERDAARASTRRWQIKQAVTGYGRASKIQVQEMTKVILGLARIPQPDHAADALAVAITHTHHNSDNLTDALRRAAAKAAGDEPRRRQTGQRGARRGCGMIASVRGKLLLADGERVVIEVGGLGLEVLASGRTLARRRRRSSAKRCRCSHLPARARGRPAALRLPRRRRARLLPVAHRHQRRGPQGGAGRAVGLLRGRSGAGRGARRRQEVRDHHRASARSSPSASWSSSRTRSARCRRCAAPRAPRPPAGAFLQARSALQNLGLSLREAEEALRGAPADAPLEELLKLRAHARPERRRDAARAHRRPQRACRRPRAGAQPSAAPLLRLRRPERGQGAARDLRAGGAQPRRHPRPRAHRRPARPGQDHAGRHHRRGAGRGHAHHLGAGHRAQGRRGRPAHQPAGGRRAVRRRDPPPQRRRRRGPLPGDGGLRDRHHDRRGPGGAQHPHAGAALHAHRRHHAHGPAHHAAARPLRRVAAPGVLRGRRAGRRSCAARRASSACRSTATPRLEIAGRSRGTPRVANRLLRRVRDFAEVRHEGIVDHDICIAALELFQVDAEGLDKLDRDILLHHRREVRRRPRGPGHPGRGPGRGVGHAAWTSTSPTSSCRAS